MSNRKFLVGVIQPDSQDNKVKNMETICGYIDEAAAKGAKLVSLPEVMNLIGENVGDHGDAEVVGDYTTQMLCNKAKEHGIYIHGGSFKEIHPTETRGYNTTVMINPQGEVIAKYQKIHTFDVVLPDGTVCDESARVCPGDHIVTVETELGHLGFAICYDIRFPELFRLMALKGAQIIFTPANFTLPTGKDHWEPILRTRAIENGCYVVAAGQIGKKPRFTAFGNSMVVDPWGTVIARAKDTPGVIIAEIDLDYLDQVRGQVPSLQNRRPDVYELTEK